MTEIEQRVETAIQTPDYTHAKFDEAAVARGAHRTFIGGHWDTHGLHQLEFLRAHGLKPGDRFLDVGCGSLRAGRHLVDYLDVGNYYGIDANVGLIRAGYDVELTDEQRAKLPAGNLRANDRFDGDFGVPFDMAIAQSVYTHVSLNYVRLSLFRIAKVVRPGGTFFATFNEQPARTDVDTIVARPHRTTQFTERNLFWYYRTDLVWASRFAPWSYRYVGEWGHPGGQKMVEFTRLTEAEWAAAKAKRAAAKSPARKPAAPAAAAASVKPPASQQKPATPQPERATPSKPGTPPGPTTPQPKPFAHGIRSRIWDARLWVSRRIDPRPKKKAAKKDTAAP